MSERIGDRAVVLGGSIAGLLAARALARHYTEVVVVDRDRLTGVRGPRRGVPHGRHAHGLVARGHQILESLFPGLTEELVEAGIRPGDFSGDIRWYFNGRLLRPARTGLVSVPATRPVLEYHLRLRVQALTGITFLEEHDVLGLVTSSDRRRVTGVRVRPTAEDAEQRELAADLVVDTTGRGSRTPAWLDEFGYRRPEEEQVKIDLAYTTRHYRLSSDPFGSDLAIIPAATPSHPRGAFFYRTPGEGHQVELSLTGVLGDHPPTDPEEFDRFTRSLPVPDIHEAVRNAEALDTPVMHRFPASRRRHYERLDRFPERLLVMGDAVCSFNPVYAQGMTVAALQSLVLERHLRAGHAPEPLPFLRDISREIDSPWEFSAGADLGYAGVKAPRPARVRLANAYVTRVQKAAVHDSALTNALMRVAGLIEPPQSLMRPATVLRVLRHAARRPPRTAPGREVPAPEKSA